MSKPDGLLIQMLQKLYPKAEVMALDNKVVLIMGKARIPLSCEGARHLCAEIQAMQRKR